MTDEERLLRRALWIRVFAARGRETTDEQIEMLVEENGELIRLTDSLGYDAEGSYSPDGQWIVFTSLRDAYNRELSDAEAAQLEKDPSYFGEIYLMRADGSDQHRLTNTPGYDGGPFFTPDGNHIVWRRFDESGSGLHRLLKHVAIRHSL